jgi:hypothetical protein
MVELHRPFLLVRGLERAHIFVGVKAVVGAEWAEGALCRRERVRKLLHHQVCRGRRKGRKTVRRGTSTGREQGSLRELVLLKDTAWEVRGGRRGYDAAATAAL